MSDQIIPLTGAPNQTFQVTVSVDGVNIALNCALSFNPMANCWVLSVFDANNNPLVLSVPMLTGVWPAANLLGQSGYLRIGSAALVALAAIPPGVTIDYPLVANLGSSFSLVWSDQPTS